MTVTQRKSQLKKLIDAERDPAVLEQVANVLAKKVAKPVRGTALVKRAMRAEEDLKAGRFQTLEEFEKDMTAFVSSLYDKNGKAKRRA